MTQKLQSTKSPEIAEIIRTTRLARRQSLRDFAKEIGVSHNSVAQWERSESKIEKARLSVWMKDDREWVRRMAFAIFTADFGAAMMAAAAIANDNPMQEPRAQPAEA